MLLKQINKSLKYFKSPLMPLSTVMELVNVCTAALKLQEKLKSKTMNDYQDVQEDCDEDQKEDFQGEYESYNDLMQVVMELCGYLIKLYKQNIESMIFTNIAPFYYKVFTNSSASENEQLYAICLFDDILEHGSQEMHNKAIVDIFTHFINLFKNTKNTDLLQSLVYGFGVFATKTPYDLFHQFYMPTVQVP